MPFLPKPVWNALKRHQIMWSATNFSSSCALLSLCWVVDGSVSATPLTQRDFLIFFVSSEFQFSDSCKRQQKALNSLTKCEDFALNVKMVVTVHSNICIPLWHLQLVMEMTLLLWTGNMKTGLTPTFSFSPGLLDLTQEPIPFQNRAKAGL